MKGVIISTKVVSRIFIFGIPALFLSILPLYLNRNWISLRINGSEVFPVIPYADSRMYLNKLKNVIDSNLEYSEKFAPDGSDSIVNIGSVLHIWGSIGRITQLDVFQTYILMTLLSGILTFFCMYGFVKVIIKESKFALIVTILIYLMVIKDLIGRPSPTQLSLWIVFILLTLIHNQIKKYRIRLFFLTIIFFLFLILTNQFYSIFILIYFTFLLIMHRKSFSPGLIMNYLFVVSIALFYYLNLDSSEKHKEMLARFGVLNDRFPGAFNLTLTLLILMFVIGLLILRKQNATFRLLFVLIISSLISLNSQVLTGVFFEAESHFGYLIRIVILLSLLYLLFDSKFYRIAPNLILSIFIVTAFYLFSSTAFRSVELDTYSSKEKKLISVLQNKTYSGSIILFKGVNNYDLLDYIPLYTNVKPFWNPVRYSEPISDKEILSRLSCTVESNYSFQSYLNDYKNIFAHKFVNEFQRYPRWDWFQSVIGGEEFSEIEGRIKSAKVQEYAFLLNYRDNFCSPETFEYDVNYVLNDQLKITNVRTN